MTLQDRLRAPGSAVLRTIITPFAGPARPEGHVAWTDSFYAALRPSAAGVYAA